ncbi:hypothetical protein ADK51_19950 [Streptomyces sp. WM6368]|nr:hypothetical protein ADK51_19950 [Streptomyces sp. WM6368]
MSLLDHRARHEAFDFTSHFREDFYACLTARGDTLFELTDAMLCEDGPVTSPVDLTLLAEHRRGHGAMYDALNQGRIDAVRLRDRREGGYVSGCGRRLSLSWSVARGLGESRISASLEVA